MAMTMTMSMFLFLWCMVMIMLMFLRRSLVNLNALVVDFEVIDNLLRLIQNEFSICLAVNMAVHCVLASAEAPTVELVHFSNSINFLKFLQHCLRVDFLWRTFHKDIKAVGQRTLARIANDDREHDGAEWVKVF